MHPIRLQIAIFIKMLKVTVLLLALALGAQARSNWSTKVFGGEDAKLGEIPYSISLQLRGDIEFGHYCGGAILNKDTVVTSATCVALLPVPTGSYAVVLAGFVSISNPGSNLQTTNVSVTYVHPNYHPELIVGPNDIAILKLEPPLELNEWVQPVSLPAAGEEVTAETGIVSGWGSSSNHSIPKWPDNLQKATLPLLSYKECEDFWGGTGASPLTNISNICTAGSNGGPSPCFNDGGSPLVVDRDGTSTLVGLVSWGGELCGRAEPSVFTKVSSFIDFIKELS